MSAVPTSEGYIEFYVAYGECFAAWSAVEFNLLAVYALLMNSSDYHAVSAAYYSTTGFRAKLEMVDAVVKNSSRVNEDARKRWISLCERVSKKAKRRNELAHNAVFFGRMVAVGERKMFLANPRTPSEGARLHAHDLSEIGQSFISLGEEVFLFWQLLQAHCAQA